MVCFIYFNEYEQLGGISLDKIKKIMTADIKVNFNVSIVVNIILYSVIIVMPFLVGKNIDSPYIGFKSIFLYIAGMLLIMCSIFRRKELFSMYREKVIVLLYLLSLIITTVYAIEPSISLIGTVDRGEGLIIYIVYFLLFLFSVRYLKVTNKMINIILYASVVMSIITIMQFYGFDLILSLLNGKISNLGTIGTIGNRNFNSTYLLLFLVLAIGYFIFYGNKKYLIISSILFGGLLSTETRSGYVALIIVIFMGSCMILKRRNLWIRALSIIICFMMTFSVLDITSSKKISNRVFSIEREIRESNKNGIESLGSSRMGIWIMTLKSIQKHPIQGSGLDTLQLRLNRDQFTEHSEYIKKHNAIIDKAHNEFLEIWACGGLISLILYIMILVFVFYEIIKMIIKNNNDKHRIIFLCILSYVIQSLFNISMIANAPLYWILLGYAVQQYRLFIK